MKAGAREVILGMTVGGVFAALIGMLFIGIILGARIGAYLNFKLNERGEVDTHDAHRCHNHGGFK